MDLLTKEGVTRVDRKERVFRICVRDADDGSFAGVVQNLSTDQKKFFAGLDQAFLLINGWMDEWDQPSGDSELREFQTECGVPFYMEEIPDDRPERGEEEPEAAAAAESGLRQCPGLGRRGAARRKEAFLVRIICRQHTSWQGEVCWKNQRLYFRSTLELMSLIHSALKPRVRRKSAHTA